MIMDLKKYLDTISSIPSKVGLVTRVDFCVPSKECGTGVGMQLEVM